MFVINLTVVFGCQEGFYNLKICVEYRATQATAGVWGIWLEAYAEGQLFLTKLPSTHLRFRYVSINSISEELGYETCNKRHFLQIERVLLRGDMHRHYVFLDMDMVK